MTKKILFINMFAAIVGFFVNFAVSFFLSPYIVKNIGADAYAFVTLANNFVSYIAIITIALNSMSGRFIAIEIHKKDIKRANVYFNSTVWSNITLVGILAIPVFFSILNIEKLINIPSNLIVDIKLLFSFVFFNFFITLVFNTLGICYFVKDKLYLSSMRNIESALIRVVFLVIIFSFFPPKVFYLGMSITIITLYTVIFNVKYSKKLLPELKISFKDFNIKATFELLSSGIWNVINQLGTILNEGLDLLICNIFIGPVEMGILAVAKTIPTTIMSLMTTMNSVFSPKITKNFAENNIPEMLGTLDKSIKIMGCLMNIPIAGFIAFGYVFFKLWMPSLETQSLYILAILSISATTLTTSTVSIYHIFTATNKIKFNSIVMIAVGFLNTVLVFILLKTTNLGVYAIAGVSSITGILKTLIFTFPYAAKCINQKWYIFYKPAFRSFFSIVIITIICYIFKTIGNVDNWLSLFIFAILSAIVGMVFNLFLVLKKDERKFLFSLIRKNKQ